MWHHLGSAGVWLVPAAAAAGKPTLASFFGLPAVAECGGEVLRLQLSHQPLECCQGSSRTTRLAAQHIKQPARVTELECQPSSGVVITILQSGKQVDSVRRSKLFSFTSAGVSRANCTASWPQLLAFASFLSPLVHLPGVAAAAPAPPPPPQPLPPSLL